MRLQSRVVPSLKAASTLLLIFLIFLPEASSAQSNLPTVAVLNIDVQVGVPEDYAVPMSDMIRTALFQTGRVRVMERNRMDDILKEQGFQLSGCTSDECAVQVGKLLGVQQMVAGSLSKLGETYTITLRLIDVETGEVLAAAMTSCRCTIDEVISGSIDEVSRKVVGLDDETVRGTGASGSSGSQPSVVSDGPLQGMSFASIPGGSFLMGSPSSEQGRDGDEGPEHRVTVSSFEMMTTEVTVAQFREFVNATGYRTEAETGDGAWISRWERQEDANWQNPYLNQTEQHPVVCVSWNDAVAFVDWLNHRDPGKGYRLPTEAEWEYACRAGTTTRYSIGDSESDLARLGWYDGNSDNTTHSVGQKEPNAWGLYDMHGNVWEWCGDWYGSNYYSSSPSTDPTGPSRGYSRVFRGGGWNGAARFCRSAGRGYSGPTRRRNFIGFRLLRSGE